MDITRGKISHEVARTVSLALAIIMFSGVGARLNAETKSLVIAQNADGRLQVFATARCDDTVFTCSQVAASNGWGPWHSLPAKHMVQCAVGQNADGRLEVFMLLRNGRCLHFWQVEANGEFTGGRDIGALTWEQIAMGRNTDGRQEVFALVGGNIYHFWQTAPNGGWSQSEPFGTVGVTQMAVGRNADGRQEVFALVGGNIYHFWQTAPKGGWSRSEPFADPAPDFMPKIISFKQIELSNDKSRLDWHVESGPCCTISIKGIGAAIEFDNLESTGSKEVWRGSPPDGGNYQYRLAVKCGKNEVDKTITVPHENRLPKPFPVTFWKTGPARGGVMYYSGTIIAPGELISISNPDLGSGKLWIVLFPKPGYTSDNCTDPNASVRILPGQSTTVFQGQSLRSGLKTGFCLTTLDQVTLMSGEWPDSWTLNITYK